MREVPASSYFIAYSNVSTGLSPFELFIIHADLWHQGTQGYQHDEGAETMESGVSMNTFIECAVLCCAAHSVPLASSLELLTLDALQIFREFVVVVAPFISNSLSL